MREGWDTKPLGDLLIDASPGFACGDDLDTGVFQIRMNNLSRDGQLVLGKRRRVPANHKKVATTTLKPGDVLFNATNSPDLVGKSAFFGGCDEPAVYSNHFLRLRTQTGKLDPRYLSMWLQREFGRGYFKSKCKQWVNQATFGKDLLVKLPIPLPPVEEQRRIASILDSADQLRTKRQQAIDQLDTLTQAIFHDMFGDPFRPGGATVELKQLAQVVMGQSPPGSSYNELGDGFPLLNGPTEFGERHPVATQWTSSPTRFSEVGDILFCVRGATAGRLNWADASYCIGRGIAAVRAQQEIARFLFTVLEAYYPRFQVMGTGSTFINISKNDLMSLPIPKASESAISKYGVAMQEIETEKRAAVSHVGSLGVLFASLQQRAFRGDL